MTDQDNNVVLFTGLPHKRDIQEEPLQVDTVERLQTLRSVLVNEDFDPAYVGYVDQAIAEIQRLRGQGWQPIETAPKDRKPILGWNEQYDILLVRWASLEEVDPDWDGEDDFECWLDEATGWLEDDLTPTHWMPLPTPPGGSE